MSISVHVVKLTEVPARHMDIAGQAPAATVATVVVGAIVSVIPDVYTGANAHGVTVTNVGTVGNQTIMFVSANPSGSDKKSRENMISTVVDRIRKFLDHPEGAYEMSQQVIFPKPMEW